MRFKGKIIGCIIGLLCFGPIGAAFGFIAGHLYDIGYFRVFLEAARGGIHTQAQRVFFQNTFRVMGYIAKADGRVSENEIRATRQVMAQLRLSEQMQQEAIALFNEGKQPGFAINTALSELRLSCHMQPILLQLFIDIQTQIVHADGAISPEKKKVLEDICEQLGVNASYNQQQYSHTGYRNTAARDSNIMTISEAYSILGVHKDTQNDAVKKAYRRLMSQHHPDKLIAEGLPPEMIKMATQKTQQIKKAYDVIKGARGL